MPYPNTVLSAWQLALIAVVAVGTLAVWLTAVYLAAREPRGERRAAMASPGEPPTTAVAASAGPTGEPEPMQQAGSRAA